MLSISQRIKALRELRYIAEIATTFEETRLDNTAGFLDFDFC